MSMQWLERVALSAILIATTAAPGGAQNTSSEFTSSRMPGWSFTPGVTIAGEFDSNVALASAPADTRQTESDRVLLAQPFVQLGFMSPRTEFSTGYQSYVRRHMEVAQLNGFDQRGYVSLRRLATKRLTLSLNDQYADVASTDEVELNGVPFSRTGVHTNAVLGGLDARLTKFTNLAVRASNTWVDFERTDTLLTGGSVSGVSTGLSRRLNERTTGGAEYAIRFADLNEGTHQLTFQDVGGTLQYAVAGKTALSLGAGVSFLEDRSFDVSRRGPYMRADVTHEAARATVGAGFERSFLPSFGFGGSNQSMQARGFIHMPLNRNRVYVLGSGSWRRTEPFVAGELELDTFAIRSTLGYSATRWLRVEGFYAFSRQDSQVTGGEINRHRVGTQMVISQPMRIR
jgi:hypothetical protein